MFENNTLFSIQEERARVIRECMLCANYHLLTYIGWDVYDSCS